MQHYSVVLQLPLVKEAPANVAIRTPADMARICADLRDLAQESFQVVLLNAKNRVLNRVLVTLGIADASLVHPREVFRMAIIENSAAIVLVHNHPSGDPTPSAEDLRITKQLVEAGKILDIKVLDHVIIGRPSDGSTGHMSLRESGYCAFA